jgi:hypothetical protein
MEYFSLSLACLMMACTSSRGAMSSAPGASSDATSIDETPDSTAPLPSETHDASDESQPADDGTQGPSSLDATDTSTRKRIFHLQNGREGRILDSADAGSVLAAADQLCVTAGEAYGGGAWKAWLSNSTIRAVDRLSDVGPWYRMDREVKLFESRAGFQDGPLAPIRPDIDPSDIRNLFWSGTSADGTPSTDNCNQWSDLMPLTLGTVGRADVAGASWVVPAPISCSAYLALLCIEQ